jgi:hypothetical protein
MLHLFIELLDEYIHAGEPQAVGLGKHAILIGISGPNIAGRRN